MQAWLNLETGAITGAVKQSERRIGDLAGVFADEAARAAMDPQTVVYRVQMHDAEREGTPGGLLFGTSIVLPGKDGLTRMAEIMQTLRDHPPVAFGDVRVTAVRDYLKSIRTCGDTVEPITLPKSNVMYFELEGGAWICVRPSGTEPKIKLYVNAVTDSHEKTQKLLAYLSDAAAEMIK